MDIQKINFLENIIRTFENIADGKHDFDFYHIRNCNSLFLYGILNSRINGDFHTLPSKKFKNIDCLIGNKRIDSGIANDINSYMLLKDKSTHGNKFLKNYSDSINDYRIYSFNLDRIIRDDNSNKFIDITCEAESDKQATVYFLMKTYATITLKYDQKAITIYKNY